MNLEEKLQMCLNIYLKEDDSSTMGFLREIQKNDSSLMKVADIESEDSKWNNKSFDEKLYHLCRVYAATKAYAKQLKKKIQTKLGEHS